jgi:hypothetical protein
MRALGVFLVFAACQSAAVVESDAPGDTGVSHAGLSVVWSTQPPLPGPLNDRITITEATFQISYLQIVGDAGPGDSRTTRSRYALTWNAVQHPPRDEFPMAPVGVYSRVAIEVRPAPLTPAYEIKGMWTELEDDDRRPAELKPFRIADFQPLSSSFECNDTLPGGGTVTIGIKLDLLDALAGINFDKLDERSGTLELSMPNDPQMMPFRDRLSHAFMSHDE